MAAEVRASTAGAAGDAPDELERRAHALGVIDVDLLRVAAPALAELSGAALERAMQRTLRDERPFLAPDMAERVAARSQSSGLDGGRGRSAARSYRDHATINDRIVGALRQRRAERHAWVETARRDRTSR